MAAPQRVSANRIARRFLPSRYHFGYAISKLATDPLYGEVERILTGTNVPLLDVGCGIGLLLHYLRASGITIGYTGVDIDAAKIDIAASAAANAGISARFATCDLGSGFPDHRGSVAILDVLQYLDPAVRDAVLDGAARCIDAEGVLILRAGLDDGSWRSGFTRMTDRAGHAVRWMKTPPRSQPTRAGLTALLARHGFRSEFHPAWGRTPFNNWLVVAAR
ncbi:MAG TPA: class I SAM-dependent methyltransferase [Povalibacter sp.]|nr:class I SAM-dependent methyltransferase [Povalibacter sp.]